MNFNSHIDKVVTVAVLLVNTLTPGEAHGRAYMPPGGRQLGEAAAAALAAGYGLTAAADAATTCPRGSRKVAPRDGTDLAAAADAATAALRAGRPETRRVSAQEAAELSAIAGALRAVFEAVAAGDVDRAAEIVNALLALTGARPHLDKHDGEPWHLHFTSADDSLVQGWAAGCATGLAVVLGSELYGRLGVCAAPHCDRVYVDTSRNGIRRFCSASCQSRVKTAAFRARQ